ncbi:histidine kinase [Sphingobium sp. C100]|jgi:signal transduction histidine kinase|uniref:sensor histidine kinase n=1 Tax=Sphingobium sp. C100 TaxID=1207055 RepID=UPI0003D5D59B|nr:HAMP domain-containing sensor histidine kinase [Sphingobium sp. C100]ETI65306.1 histidine kinase [Sphingobium sp. C100]
MARPWRSTFGLVALVAFCFALATLVIGVVAYEVTHEALEIQLDHRVAIETRALIDEGDDGPAGVAAAIRRREAARSTASLDYLLVDPSGRRVAGPLDATAPITPGYLEFLHYRRDGEQRIAQALTTRLPDNSRLVVAADRGVIDEMDATLLKLFAGAFGLMLLLGIGAAWLVGAVTRARLSRIDRTALAIIDGDLARRMPLTGAGDEFDRVATTLNRMLDRIGGLMDNLRQVSSDVAHDLRTPLTRLHNRLDEALSARTGDDKRQAIEAAAQQSRELLDIFAALLRIAEVEALSPCDHFQDLPLDQLVEELVETYRPDMEVSGHRLVTAIAPAIWTTGDRRLLQQLITNLLDNALRHTPPGTTVRVALERDDAFARLTVADDGHGVAPEDATRLFQRFARAEASRSSEGHGLGLALVAAVATAHRGMFSLLPSPGFGVVVEIPVGKTL